MPEELEDVDDVPAALLEDELLSVVNAREAARDGGSGETLRKGVGKKKGYLVRLELQGLDFSFLRGFQLPEGILASAGCYNLVL